VPTPYHESGIHPFGVLADGTRIDAIVLDSGGLRAEILTYGGILRSLSVPVSGKRHELVLGLPGLDEYVRDPAFLGCIIGRVSNRIARARFALHGREYRLIANDGDNHLHGGRLGFGKRVWSVHEMKAGPPASLRLAYRSPAGEEGYPGTVEVTADFTLSPSTLELRFTAHSDAATPISLSYHPYFNLAGDPQVPAGKQLLRIPSETFLPVDKALLPVGTCESAEGTPFDFRGARKPGEQSTNAHPQLLAAGGYDHCMVLDPASGFATELESPHSGIRMRIGSDAPALQFYDGHGLRLHHPELGSGLCLEPQAYPDAVNQAAFPSMVLEAGGIYSRRIVYEFDALPVE